MQVAASFFVRPSVQCFSRFSRFTLWSRGVKISEEGSMVAKWGQVRSSGVSWGQLGSGGVKCGQVKSDGT